jgi:hypothetical protein
MGRVSLAAIAAAALAIACVTPSTSPAQGEVPDWVFATPQADAVNTYFVGMASDASGDMAAATNDAAANLIASITQYIGVKLSVATSAEAKASLDSYSANIRSTVTSSSQNQVAGFSIKERFVQSDKDKKNKRVTVYILAAYATTDLEREKARIAKLIAQGSEAIEGPEREAQSLLEQGRAYDAVRKYAEAAVAASTSQVDNAKLYLERDVNAARTLLSRLRFDASSSAGYAGTAGVAFPRPFTAKLVFGEGASAPGVPGAAVLFSYQRKSGARLVPKIESLMTDQRGLLSFAPPAPDFVGAAVFSLRLDFQSTLDLLDTIPEKYATYRDALEDELRSKSLELPYEVVSAGRSSSIAVAIVDLDESGVAVPGAKAQGGLVEALTREKMSVRGLSVSPEAVAAADSEAAMRAAAGGSDRVVYGVAKVTELHKDGTSYLASGLAEVKLLDVSSGALLYSSERMATGLGSDEVAARASLFRALGLNAVAKDLLANMP